MYEEFYNFHTKPFSLLPDARFLYPSTGHRMALDVLEYGLLHRLGIVVVTGEVGSGKTTLLRYLLTRLDKDVTIGLISNTHPALGPLLPWILEAYDIKHDGASTRQFHALLEHLLAQYAERRNVLLVIDEAQNLDNSMLEELRVLSNVNTDQDQILQIILIGQPELRSKLSQPACEAFAQRVAAEYHLQPLKADEVCAYIRHRLTFAGGEPDIFETDACRLIAHCSRGIPRLINSVCDLALVYGFAEQRSRIDISIVHDVVRDKLQGAIVPLERRDFVSNAVMSE